MSLKIQVKAKRKPDRTKSTANISVSWSTYDALDKLAAKSNASLSAVIQGLVEHYEENK
jgi:predicted CopG family antitoxin|tara:strand:+ start:112 stop:288 length:177 start_codon:yes stop_codon:yes gene_type:complete